MNNERYTARLNIERSIACPNIEHYKKLLETDIDETKQEVVMPVFKERLSSQRGQS